MATDLFLYRFKFISFFSVPKKIMKLLWISSGYRRKSEILFPKLRLKIAISNSQRNAEVWR